MSFLKNNINCFCFKVKNKLTEQNQEYLEFITDEEEAIIEKTIGG